MVDPISRYRCAHFISAQPGSEPQKDIFLEISGSKISRVEPWQSKFTELGPITHLAHHLVMPGLINGHTHLPMTLFRGLADDLPFQEWLFKYILPLERKQVTRDFVRIGAELAALECTRMGVTTVCDMYFFEYVTAEVFDRAGLRGIFGQSQVDAGAPDDPEAKGEAWKLMDQLVQMYGNHERIYPALAAHAPYTVSDDLWHRVQTYSEKNNVRIVTHVSETQHEVDDSQKIHGKSPVARLRDLGVLGPHCVLAHCVHLSDADIEILKSTKAGVVHNPESNMKLGAGVAPVPALLKRGVKVGLGTDGAASNNDLSIFREMDSAAKLQKLSHHDNTAMTAKQALSLATLGGAAALGLDHEIGSLEFGKRADFIALNLQWPHLQPVHDVLSLAVYSATGCEVDWVICHGEVLLKNGQPTRLDAARIYREAEEQRQKMQAVIANF